MRFDKDMMESLDRVSDDLGEKTETAAVGTYRKIEDAVVGGFARVTDKMVEKLFAREGETAEEARDRLEAARAGK